MPFQEFDELQSFIQVGHYLDKNQIRAKGKAALELAKPDGLTL